MLRFRRVPSDSSLDDGSDLARFLEQVRPNGNPGRPGARADPEISRMPPKTGSEDPPDRREGDDAIRAVPAKLALL